jgi:hypothetical protein
MALRSVVVISSAGSRATSAAWSGRSIATSASAAVIGTASPWAASRSALPAASRSASRRFWT